MTIFYVLGYIFISLGIISAIFLQALVKIPVLHVLVVTIFGRRFRWIKREGWAFLFFRKVFMDGIVISVKKRNIDLEPQEVIAPPPDYVAATVPISYTYTPDYYSPVNLNEFLDSDSDEGVRNIIDDRIAERLRIWVTSPGEGPQSGEDLLQAHDEAIRVLIEEVVGPVLGDTSKNPTAKNISLEQRKLQIEAIKHGNGHQPIPQLGIILKRLNVGEIRPHGEWSKALEKRATEKLEAAGERVEQDFILESIQKYVEILGISPEQAQEIIQTERHKVTKNISEVKLSFGQGSETLEKLGGVFAPFLGMLTGNKTPKRVKRKKASAPKKSKTDKPQKRKKGGDGV